MGQRELIKFTLSPFPGFFLVLFSTDNDFEKARNLNLGPNKESCYACSSTV